jgi:hypothetical protein
MRWRWRRLLIIPLLGSAHACDCGGCGDSSGGTGSRASSSSSSGSSGCEITCGPVDLNACGVGGLCLPSVEGGTCPGGLLLDPRRVGDGGGVCCLLPAPACLSVGGVCQTSCPRGTVDGDCGDAGVCCMPAPGGDDGSSGMAATDEEASTDAEDAMVEGSCNGAPCASGCSCVPFLLDAASASSDGATIPADGATLSEDAGGGMCVCPLADAGADAEGLEDADAADAAASGESGDAEMSDAAEAGDAMTPADASDAGGSCGVILCVAGCACTTPAASACTCP